MTLPELIFSSPEIHALQRRYREVREYSLALAAPLSDEDQCIQSMAETSPTKWHLAHTTWFFETLLLQCHAQGYQVFNPRFEYLFNSYYDALGPRHPRSQRGLLTRPARQEVHAYRRYVDHAVLSLMSQADTKLWADIEPIITLGLQHEQQHQELILTDMLHALSCNPLQPAYRASNTQLPTQAMQTNPMHWIELAGGAVDIGHDNSDGSFGFDNEGPRHKVLLRPYAISDRLVTCGDYAQFVAANGYLRADPWLSDGWAIVQAQGWRHPAYWLPPNDPRLFHLGEAAHQWHVFGLDGLQPLDPNAPVSQLSFYEAAAYAQWVGARLPTEFEWEAAFAAPGISQMTGHVWQWTRSSYDPYPGFKPLAGVASEYNGKFMVGQLVLRGGSAATPAGHTRSTYRNFFPPSARWQLSGLRLARDL
ncbi:ergothioneine biosynthesis protein EgtB [Dyella silvatica]|uniref:ergothioneine biosynthesis protein EgtB n=1 Tax=Dyella silvatica TaxID=2992128 RepID=UPI00225AFD4E|nr:ergothioneine biosynthesis protein EgtB [Dyella silvatica]